jgi:muscleblind protein
MSDRDGRDGGRDGPRGPQPDRSMEVCREFTRQRCNRSETECRFAHPPNYVEIINGRVTCCVDSIKGRCQREKCRYFHPPPHLGERVLYGAGRSAPPPPPGPGRDTFGAGMNPYQIASTLRNYKSALDAALAASWLTGPGGGPGPDRGGPGRTDTIEVCREFLRGKCTRPAESCRYAHPPDNINVGFDNTVIACIDFIKGRCQRDPCRYFHPPEHLQSRVRFSGGPPPSQGGRKRPYSSSDQSQGEYGIGDHGGYKRAAYDDGGP